MVFRGTIKITREEEWFVAVCIENNVASQGKTIDESVENLREAISLYYEDEAQRRELSSLQERQVYITNLEMAL
ncbi:MAG: type II toxin-antitoxin system HicB family antitoxin, partial [Chitinivibrionia bacterium]|nr:type II toxin-antitoxin system HicB family antitoxin [Chitinivibrionia bacterium]